MNCSTRVTNHSFYKYFVVARKSGIVIVMKVKGKVVANRFDRRPVLCNKDYGCTWSAGGGTVTASKF